MSSQKIKSKSKPKGSNGKSAKALVHLDASRQVHDFKKETIHQSVKRFLGLVRPILQERLSIEKARQVYANAKFDLSDCKGDPLSSRSAANAAQLKLVRSNLASMYGTKPVPFRFAVSFDFSTDAPGSNPTGTLATVLPITPNSSVEWPSIMALFDEFRVVGAKMAFNVNYASPEILVGATTPANTINNSTVIMYDPSDGTVLTSVRNGCEEENHMILGTVSNDTRIGSAGARVTYARAAAKPFEWHYRVPSGILIGQTAGAVSIAEGAWAPTATSISAPLYWGYVKMFGYTNTTTTSAPFPIVVSGIHYIDVLLRVRA